MTYVRQVNSGVVNACPSEMKWRRACPSVV